MNIQQAVKTGLPYKREGWTHWVQTHWKTPANYSSGKQIPFKIDDLSADDWEVKEPKKSCCCKCCCCKG